MNVIAGAFLVLHGGVHALVWCTPADRSRGPFDPRHTWLARRSADPSPWRTLAVVSAAAIATMFVVAGVLAMVGTPNAAGFAAAAASMSLVLTGVYFNRWLLGNAAIDAAILWIAWSVG